MTKRDLEATPWNPWPNRIWPPPITLPAVTTSEITDTMIGLPEDAVAQRRAEQYVRAALSYRQKQAERAEIAAARSALVAATRRTLIRTASPADDVDDLDMVPDDADMVPDDAEMVSAGRFQ